MTFTTVQAINAEIRLLEAHKKFVEKKDAEVSKALAVLKKFARMLTAAQRRAVSKVIGSTIDAAPVKVGRLPRKGRKLGKVAPKYQLPSGEVWSGRGHTPRVFVAWEKGAIGKAWRQANAGARFPAATGASAPTAPASAAVKDRRKAAGKRVAKKVTMKKAK